MGRNSWGVSIALAMSIPKNEYSTAILSITYFVVVFSIIVQGLTIGKVANPKRLQTKKRTGTDYRIIIYERKKADHIGQQIEEALQMLSTPERAVQMPRYFKTGKGEYGEGDIFYGVSVPDQRSVAKEFYKEISLEELSDVLKSEVHEMRLTAILIVVAKYEKAKRHYRKKEKLVDFYLNHLEYVNNWDIVDSSAQKYWEIMLSETMRKKYYTDSLRMRICVEEESSSCRFILVYKA